MKIRTLAEFEESLDNDLGWRKKEITNFKFLIGKENRQHYKELLLRSAIAILYSHWEGHIKHCALCYLHLINKQGVVCGKLQDNFAHLMLGVEFGKDINLKNIHLQKKVFEYIANIYHSQFKITPELTIDTESNLKYEVLEKISLQIGVSLEKFTLRENFINEVLLNGRNNIAHGTRLDVKQIEKTYAEIEDDLLAMIQEFHNIVRNAAVTKAYLKHVVSTI